MYMNYDEALLKVSSLIKFGVKPGLSRVKKFLEFLGSPQDNLKVVHVAGTNAKGSVCFMLESVLRSCGYKTGLYISPSISDFRERICVGGKMISKADFCNLVQLLQEFQKEFGADFLTEFEALTAMALKHFFDQKCEIVVLETGMGGRLDATNVVKAPLCSVVTTVSLDHTKLLGESTEKIAAEKLGIVKPSCPLVIGGGQQGCVYDLAEKVCKKLGSELIISDEKSVKNFKAESLKKSSFEFSGESFKLGLLGTHQRHNVAIVLSVLKILEKSGVNLPLEKIKKGFSDVKVPCRIEVLKESPLVILDASHNVESVTALAKFIEGSLRGKQLVALVGMFADKDAEGVFKIIGKYFKKIAVVKSENPRSMAATELEKIAKKYCSDVVAYEDIALGAKKTLAELSGGECLVAFGSFSIMGSLKKIILSS